MTTFYKTIKFLLQHPIGRKKMIKTLFRFFIWQFISRFLPNGTIKPWVENAKLFMKKSLHSATANYYVGLQEFEEMSFLLHVLVKDDLFVDIGSNVGVYAILASKLKEAKTIAFEPANEAIKILKRNIQINEIQHFVTICQSALGETKEISYITNNQDSENHIVTNFSNSNQKIEINRLDDMVDEIPVLIKIDTEGFEYKILKGGKRLIENYNQKAIIIEMNGASLRYGDKDIDLHNLLTSQGYKIYTYSPFEKILKLSNSYLSGNNIYIKDIDFINNRIRNSRMINIFGNKF
jgi:FkbM family methyltransferase